LQPSILQIVSDLPVLGAVQKASKKLDVRAYLVGGFVRDLLLNRTSKDIDIVVVGNGLEFATEVAKQLKNNATLALFKNFGTAQIKFDDLEVEFVGARKESYNRGSRNPIVEEGSLIDDLSRRDFTINALAMSLQPEDFGEITDLFDGIKDLDAGILRTPLDPDITFSDDPLRMMRAVRFASQLGFTLFPETKEAIHRNRERISIISQERITDELNKIIMSRKPSVGFKLLFETGLLDIIFPEMVLLQGVKTINNQAHKDNFFHTLEVLDNVAYYSDYLWLRWAAILHDIGKPQSQRFDPDQGWTFHGHEMIGSNMTPRIFRRMKLPMNERMKYVQKLVALHLRPIALTHDVTDSAVRRLIVDAGEDIDDLLELCRADVTSKNVEKVNRYLKRFDDVEEKIREVEEKDSLRNWKPPITGEIIMETFGIAPSKNVGIIKEAVKEAIIEGEIPNSYDEAYAYMLKIAGELGFFPKN